ncbi:amidohydrolase [Kineosporia rhizophila]|uniref:amidohydrolase n=1 Tax=Kineosporia TaxID=49184 RepID=UPI001E4AFF64|nr:amidohydrolase [Kineosporia sp. NBRC 101677]MCE0536356.1 amidohydrolase [Kineosporia rhizophila]GLY19831.1 amidohydrolase [Kineosporia sp. NBRC 101677]
MADADLVFTGGTVACLDAARTRTGALAVRGGRIVALGAPAQALIGSRTEVVDLAGRLLLPGFQDAHVHAVFGGLELAQCDLTGTTDVAEYRRRIAAYAQAHPEVEWITGSGWSMESFPGGVPTADLLDDVVPDRPVFLYNRDHHGAWVNTRALQRAGLDAGTPDPADGLVNRDAEGRPVGALQEGAISLVADLVPKPTAQDRLDGLLRAQRLLHSLGITAWQDAMLCGRNGFPDVSDAYRTAAERDLLTADVVGALWWDRDRGGEQIAELVHKREIFTVGRLRSSTVKIMQDGVAENFTAGMTVPYKDACGCSTGNAGLSFVEPAALREYVTALDALDFQIHFHALGDRAVREALDAVEAARKTNGHKDTRPHLAHLQVIHPTDVARFGALGATANLQALWAAHEPQMDELTIPFLGGDLARHQYPFGDLLRAGARLAAGSDWPVSDANPIAAVHTAVNRRPHGEQAPVFLPEQLIDLHSALTAYTAGSAYVNHRDDTGTLAVGHRADLVVLDRDLFALPADEIGAATVDLTFIDGNPVHQGSSSG